MSRCASIILGLLLIACQTPSSNTAVVSAPKERPLPKGWKIATPPTTSLCDRSQNWLFALREDFDGDTAPDEAKLLASQDGETLGLWIWQSNGYPPKLYQRINTPGGLHDVALAVMAPQTIKTACGAGKWKCQKGEEASVTFPYAAIKLYTCGGAARVIYFNEAQNQFQEAWLPESEAPTAPPAKEDELPF